VQGDGLLLHRLAGCSHEAREYYAISEGDSSEMARLLVIGVRQHRQLRMISRVRVRAGDAPGSEADRVGH